VEFSCDDGGGVHVVVFGSVVLFNIWMVLLAITYLFIYLCTYLFIYLLVIYLVQCLKKESYNYKHP
jgi:hypothetical protein